MAAQKKNKSIRKLTKLGRKKITIEDWSVKKSEEKITIACPVTYRVSSTGRIGRNREVRDPQSKL